MNKTDLIAAVTKIVAADTGRDVPRTLAASVIDATLAAIASAVDVGDKVQLRGFGNFKAHTKAERRGRNPKTGAELIIPSKTTMKFTPAKKGESAA